MEQLRDPTVGEFLAFLQLSSTFDWRTPKPEEKRQLLAFESGKSDQRLKPILYKRVQFLCPKPPELEVAIRFLGD